MLQIDNFLFYYIGHWNFFCGRDHFLVKIQNMFRIPKKHETSKFFKNILKGKTYFNFENQLHKSTHNLEYSDLRCLGWREEKIRKTAFFTLSYFKNPQPITKQSGGGARNLNSEISTRKVPHVKKLAKSKTFDFFKICSIIQWHNERGAKRVKSPIPSHNIYASLLNLTSIAIR